MEPLQRQLFALPARLAAMSTRAKVLLGLMVLGLAGVAIAANALIGVGDYQYAFTNLSTEDAAEIQAQLNSANVPHRLEAGGTALAVPANKVYEVRLLLAAAGLPRSTGVGFELFDKGDFGVSEFTQKVNLRRATEGELARTVGRLTGVRSARVHLVMPEKAVFRGEERPASAAVVLNLQPGKVLSERELAGIKHLIASAVPSLPSQSVTIVDGRGAVLSAEDGAAEEAQGYARKLERDLEQRVVTLLEPVVGAGQVVARVTADVDSSEVNSTNDNFDPDGAVLKSERTVAQNQQSDKGALNGAVGAVANQPLASPPPAAGTTNKSNNTSNEESRTYEVSRVTTHTISRMPRLTRLSVAVLLDGIDGKPRAAADVQRLGELVRKAVGFDPNRGDQLEISSETFSHSADEVAPAAASAAPVPAWWLYAAGGGGALLVLCALVLVARKRAPANPPLMLRTGSTVAQIEAAALGAAEPARAAVPLPLTAAPAGALEAGAVMADGSDALRLRARELAKSDPARAANLIRSWLSTGPTDSTRPQVNNG